jgi:hypothetical protein
VQATSEGLAIAAAEKFWLDEQERSGWQLRTSIAAVWPRWICGVQRRNNASSSLTRLHALSSLGIMTGVADRASRTLPLETSATAAADPGAYSPVLLAAPPAVDAIGPSSRELLVVAAGRVDVAMTFAGRATGSLAARFVVAGLDGCAAVAIDERLATSAP